jgi:membrane associated rhomboid family serine protease
VKQAVVAIWATIAISALGAAVATRLGYTSQGELAFTLILYGLLCIMPYKIGNGSNPARYVFLILTALSIIFAVSGGPKISKPDAIAGLIQAPFTIFAAYRLLQRQANEWFTARRQAPLR